MATQTPVEQFNSLLSSSSILFVVFYRGHWCPFCRAYLQSLQKLSPSITALGGKTLTVTSEPASFLSETRKLSGYQGDAIVDTENTLVGLVKERYGLEVAVSEKKGYENGMAQPAILVLRGEKGGEIVGPERTVLEKWAIIPSVMNLGGASDRPDLEQVWDNVRAKVDGKARIHQGYKTTGLLGMLWGKFLG
ncbi:hypothetical protein LTR84_006570 [Exophiala bonariae]|uniref:Alkyl hydroperoxide reductase subunit C/ Thiol specific antioxidant domain-containing protein n=1 Tax=Exophiala bonariae TaxID=1690606 RepID=A0AAV9N0H6_9EURO|nr:hypothetical protein LTR84_006570 [Exophiala bonariae]